MKKKIHSEIVELAKQIIANEKTFDVASVKQIVGQLYEKLAVLNYLESQLGDDVSKQQKQSLDSKSFREENWFTEPEPLPKSQHTEELAESVMEKIKDIVAQMPEESQRVDELLEEVLPQKKYIRNDLEEFAANYQQTPTFERKEPAKGIDAFEGKGSNTFPLDQSIKNQAANEDIQPIKPKSLNEKLNQGLSIGLNDRLAFIKHLFNDSVEDYTRVLSQISTMKSYEDATAFIKGRVKPDYNDWLQKDEYSERFMAIVEKNFN